MLAFAVCAVVAWHVIPIGPQVVVLREQTIDVRGMKRQYRLVIPKSLEESSPSPLLFAFPGAGDSAEDMSRYTQLDWLAADRGFYLVYLEGRYLSWPPFIPPENPECADPDLHFFDAVCDELIPRYNIDERRVYATGMSQGAAFVNLLVAKRSRKLAAAAVHSGWLPRPLPDEGIHADHKTPMLFIVGSDDRQVPPDVVSSAYECFRREGHPSEYYEVPGLGHAWAGRQGINEQIWQFLSQCRVP